MGRNHVVVHFKGYLLLFKHNSGKCSNIPITTCLQKSGQNRVDPDQTASEEAV